MVAFPKITYVRDHVAERSLDADNKAARWRASKFSFHAKIFKNMQILLRAIFVLLIGLLYVGDRVKIGVAGSPVTEKQLSWPLDAMMNHQLSRYLTARDLAQWSCTRQDFRYALHDYVHTVQVELDRVLSSLESRIGHDGSQITPEIILESRILLDFLLTCKRNQPQVFVRLIGDHQSTNWNRLRTLMYWQVDRDEAKLVKDFMDLLFHQVNDWNIIEMFALTNSAVEKYVENSMRLVPPELDAGVNQPAYDIAKILDDLESSDSLFSVNVQNNAGKTPLLVAIENYDWPLVRRLVHLNADVNDSPMDNRHPLSLVAVKATPDIVQDFLNHGAFIDVPSTLMKNTPLMLAVECRRAGATSVLLRHHASVTQQNANGATALHLAVDAGMDDNQIVKELLERGSDVHHRNRFGRSVLMVALQNSYISPETVELLLNHGASLLETNTFGKGAGQSAVLGTELMRIMDPIDGVSVDIRVYFHLNLRSIQNRSALECYMEWFQLSEFRKKAIRILIGRMRLPLTREPRIVQRRVQVW